MFKAGAACNRLLCPFLFRLGINDWLCHHRQIVFHVLQKVCGLVRLCHAAPLCTGTLVLNCRTALSQSHSAVISSAAMLFGSISCAVNPLTFASRCTS